MLNLNELIAKQDQLKRSVTAHDENRVNVRQRVEDVKHPLLPAVAEALFDLWKSFSSSSLKSKLEIEIRIGSVVFQKFRFKPQITEKFVMVISDQDRQRYGNNMSFESGIDEILASYLQTHILIPTQYHMTEEPLQRLRFDGGSNRYEVNENGVITASEKKTKLSSTDFSLLGHHYDMRIAIATEENQDIASNDRNLHNLKMVNERIKKRKSYKSIDSTLQDWKIDLTEVESFQLDPTTGNKVYTQSVTTTPSSKLREIELEIEMESTTMLEWLNITEELKALEYTKKIANSLVKLLNTLIPSESESILEKFVQVQQTAHYFNQINKINQRMTSGTGFASQSSNSNAAPSFLGSKPLNLTRRNLYHIETMPYYITEKSDGLRSLLYVLHDVDNITPIAVLMSRAKDVKIFKINGSQILGKALGYGTVLDGELVYNISFKRTVFLVFDVLCIDSKVLTKEPFQKRLKCLNEDIMHKCAYVSKLYEQQMSAHRSQSSSSSSSNEFPLEIIRKIYFTKSEISKLTERIQTVDNSYVYYDTSRRHHLMDGIIFQPDMPYTFGTQPDLLKWKFSDLRSIDLLALYDASRDRVQLLCSGPDGALIDVSKRSANDCTLFGKFDKYRLLADIHDGSLTANKPKIIECMFDVHIGLWKYLKFRKDKDEPNYIDTVVGVFMEQSENITIAELISTLKS